MAVARVLTEPENESFRLFDWRRDELERAGYPRPVASMLADNPSVDLERARSLIAKGATVEQAVEILL